MSIWYKKVKVTYYKAIVYVFGVAFIVLSGCKSKNSTNTDVPEIAPLDSVITKSDSTIKDNDTLLVVPANKKKKKSTNKPHENSVLREVQADYGVKTNDY